MYYGTSTVVTSYGPYSVSLSLSPTGVFSGTITGSTSGGYLTISSIYILSANTFTLTASASGLNSVTSSSFTVTNYVSTMSVSVSNTNPSQYFVQTLTVLLYGPDGNAFTGTCAVTSSCNGMIGTLTGSNSLGTATITPVYFTVLGPQTITVSVPAYGSYPAVSKTLATTILEDYVEITSFTPVFLYLANNNNRNLFNNCCYL